MALLLKVFEAEEHYKSHWHRREGYLIPDEVLLPLGSDSKHLS